MFLTKECDYGLRIVRTLGGGYKKNAEDICTEEQIPSQYVYKILKKLDRAGIVQSIRGRDGGYKLAMPLDAFSIFDVVSAIDDSLSLSECMREGKKCPRNSVEQPCAVHKELARVQEILIGQLRMKTMLEVVAAGE